MILHATVYVICLDPDPPSSLGVGPPLPRAVVQEDVAGWPLMGAPSVMFQAKVIDCIRRTWPRRTLEISFGPVGVPWSLQ